MESANKKAMKELINFVGRAMLIYSVPNENPKTMKFDNSQNALDFQNFQKSQNYTNLQNSQNSQ